MECLLQARTTPCVVRTSPLAYMERSTREDGSMENESSFKLPKTVPPNSLWGLQATPPPARNTRNTSESAK